MNVHRSIRPQYEYHLVSVIEAVWCSECQLPSAIELRYVIVARLDPTRWLGEQVTSACRECGVTTYHAKPD